MSEPYTSRLVTHPAEIDIPLFEKVAFLKQPSSYPEPPDQIETIETHMSWVFLAGALVYKMKKPVTRDFLDFSTVERRRKNGLEEVRLNRRLAGDVYLGLAPLVAETDGTLRLDVEGTAVDWLVKMRRLPADRMLDYVIEQGTPQEEDLRRVASMLATFYRDAVPEPLPADEYLRRRRNDVRENAEALRKKRYGLPEALVESVISRQERFLDQSAHLLKERAAGEKIVEAHGDLRPEHICLLPEPVIFDCLEFNRSFRILDPVDELAFLTMECEYLGAPPVGRILFETYDATTSDHPAEELVDYYKSYRAGLRAKLAIWHLKDDHVASQDRWRRKAIEYLELAERYLPPQ